MRRHIKTIHYDSQDDDKSVEQEGMGSGIDEDHVEESSKGGSVETKGSNFEEEDNEEEEEEYEEDDPWLSLIETVFEQCQRKFDKRVANHMFSADMEDAEARKLVYRNMLPIYRKVLTKLFVDKVLWFRAMKRDPIFKTVKRTASDLIDLEDYDGEEAWKSAVNKRKFLFDRVLREYEPPEVSVREEDEPENDEQQENGMPVTQRGGGGGGPIAQIGGGGGASSSSRSQFNVKLVSPSEQVALQAKDELLRAGQKRGYEGFTPEDSATIDQIKTKRTKWAPWTVIKTE